MRTSLSLPSQEKKKRPYFSRGAAAFLSGLSVPTATFVLSLSLSLSLPAVPPPVWRGGGLACTKSQKIRRKTDKINSPVVFECIAHLATRNRHLDVGAFFFCFYGLAPKGIPLYTYRGRNKRESQEAFFLQESRRKGWHLFLSHSPRMRCRAFSSEGGSFLMGPLAAGFLGA